MVSWQMLVSKILPIAAGFIPVSSFLFSEATLIAELTVLSSLAVEDAAGFGFGENCSRGVIDDGCGGEAGFDSFFDKLNDFDGALVGAVECWDFELVSDFESGAGFEVLSRSFYLTSGAIVRGLSAGFIKASCPKPFIGTHRV